MSTLELMKRIAVTKFINLRFIDQTKDLSHVLVDSQRMVQVLISVISNAISVSKVNSVVTITIKNQESSTSQAFFYCYIQD